MLSDAQLAKRAAAGDTQAFTLIFERHHQGIYRYCRSMLGHEDASDALQSTMVAALRSLPGERRDIALKPWLYRIAHNESVSLIRRRRPSAEVPEDIAVEGGPQENAESRERLASLLTDLRELPERQSAALVMRELNGIDYAEIGAAFAISPAAAKQSVYNARVALAQFAEGRAMDCESSRQAISGRDGRSLRSLKLRAHLRHCDDCASFRAVLAERRSDLSALAPPLAPAAAAALLENLLQGGGAGGGGLLAFLSGAASKVATGGAAFKASAAVVVTLVGAGAATVAGLGEAAPRGGDGIAQGSARAAERAPGPAGARREAARERSLRDPDADGARDSGRAGNPSPDRWEAGPEPSGPGHAPAADAPGRVDAGDRAPASNPPSSRAPTPGPGRGTAGRPAPSDVQPPLDEPLGGSGGPAASLLVPAPPVPAAPESSAPGTAPIPGS